MWTFILIGNPSVVTVYTPPTILIRTYFKIFRWVLLFSSLIKGGGRFLRRGENSGASTGSVIKHSKLVFTRRQSSEMSNKPSPWPPTRPLLDTPSVVKGILLDATAHSVGWGRDPWVWGPQWSGSLAVGVDSGCPLTDPGSAGSAQQGQGMRGGRPELLTVTSSCRSLYRSGQLARRPSLRLLSVFLVSVDQERGHPEWRWRAVQTPCGMRASLWGMLSQGRGPGHLFPYCSFRQGGAHDPYAVLGAWLWVFPFLFAASLLVVTSVT